jgi:hypothetical protein
LAEALAKSDAKTIVGGGDSVTGASAGSTVTPTQSGQSRV